MLTRVAILDDYLALFVDLWLHSGSKFGQLRVVQVFGEEVVAQQRQDLIKLSLRFLIDWGIVIENTQVYLLENRGSLLVEVNFSRNFFDKTWWRLLGSCLIRGPEDVWIQSWQSLLNIALEALAKDLAGIGLGWAQKILTIARLLTVEKVLWRSGTQLLGSIFITILVLLLLSPVHTKTTKGCSALVLSRLL